MTSLIADKRWAGFGVSQAYLEEKAEWMSRDPGYPGAVIMYFSGAGSVMRFSWFDYTLVSVVFFQSVVGLEGMVRHFYNDQATAFSVLLSRVVRTGVVSDASFSNIARLPKSFSDNVDKGAVSYSEQLASLLPQLRNEYLHGTYRLSPDLLPLAIHVREAADAIYRAQRGAQNLNTSA